jgi:predicted nucleic acid-binding protein
LNPKEFVLDASVALCWCFPDQANPCSELVMRLVEGGAEAVVPFIWPVEMSNALLIAERHKKVSASQTAGFFRRAAEWLGPPDVEALGPTFESLVNIARHYQLSSYDAAYLELAIRKGLALATLDGGLRSAARRAGVKLAPSSG